MKGTPIKATPKKKTDPRVKNYNKLLKRIEFLESEKLNVEKALDMALEYHYKNLKPLEMEMTSKHISLIECIFNQVPTLKLKAKDEHLVINFLVDSIEDIFERDESLVDSRLIEIYDIISPISFENFKLNRDYMQRNIFESMLKNSGIQVDLDDFNVNDLINMQPEAMEEFLKRAKESEAKHTEKETNKPPKQKSKKELAKEKAAIQQEEFAAKSLKDIYTSLAKIIHPDKELDPNLKQEKEDWMKKLTVAYKEKDLSTLLKIEHYWLGEDKFDPLTAPKAKFDLYMEYLQERANEISSEIDFIRMNPRFQPLNKFHYLHHGLLKLELEDETFRIKEHLSQVEDLIETLKNTVIKPNTKKKKLVNFAQENSMSDFDYFDDF